MTEQNLEPARRKVSEIVAKVLDLTRQELVTTLPGALQSFRAEVGMTFIVEAAMGVGLDKWRPMIIREGAIEEMAAAIVQGAGFGVGLTIARFPPAARAAAVEVFMASLRKGLNAGVGIADAAETPAPKS